MLRQYSPYTGNCPGLNPDGTGLGAGAGPCVLTQAQIIDLETQNPALLAEIQSAALMGTLSQGLSWTDPVYGNVVVTEDANGNLVIDANSPVNPNVINAPPYTSPTLPPGSCTTEVLGICLDSFIGALKSSATLIAIGLGLYLLSGSRR